MKKLFKRMTVICMALAVLLSMMPFAAETVYADTKSYKDVDAGGFKADLWDDHNDGSGVGVGSVNIKSYLGSSKEIVIPTKITTEGVTFTADPSYFEISDNAFKDNKTITKVAIPQNIAGIGSGAFSGCTSLTEVSIGSLIDYGPYEGIGAGVFTGCTSLTTYNIDSSGMDAASSAGSISADDLKNQIKNAGIGTDASGNPIAGVTVWTQENSIVWQAIMELNESRPDGKKIALNKSDDPYSRNTISKSGDDGSGDGSGNGNDGNNNGGSTDNGKTDGTSSTGQKGEDGTAYGKGASADVVDKAITKYSKETDPAGTVFGLLQARLYKITKTSVTLKWKKVSGAKKYVIYGNICGKTKPKKLATVKGTSKKFTKVAGKKVKKGTYYKFIVVALDKNNKVISTSKMVHAATKGGKYGNDKAVKTKAKKDKVTLKKGKSFKLNAKPVAQSKKLKVDRHRGIKYESSNKKIATVSSKGVIKAKKKGTCYVYAYAQNGVFKKIKVSVK